MDIYNSLTRVKSPLIPLKPNEIGMYVCGMTVYDYCHIGHARVMITFDVLNRYLRALGYRVKYVRNITDIDDKIIARANENGESVQSLTTRFIDAMHEDEQALLVQSPDEEPKATETIPEMIAHIKQLIDLGHAYVAESGDVLYAVSSFADYGKLAHQKLDELQAGQRVEIDKHKKNPLDFVLWKAAKPNEPFWPSPWGNGRPGWHIECSAMSRKALGDHFDIHGGGLDLKFPHHECEIAQSEPVCGGKHVNYWIHNGFVQVDAEKMSKSLGNFFTIREVLAKFSGEVIRFFMLGTHYRSPLNYSDAGLQEAKNALSRLYTALRHLSLTPCDLDTLKKEAPKFFAALDDDLNTAQALSVLFALAKNIHKTEDLAQKQQLASVLKSLGGLLGILQQDPDVFLQQNSGNETVVDTTAIEALITERANARSAKDFARADAIRQQLHDMGVEIEDNAGKTTWRLR